MSWWKFWKKNNKDSYLIREEVKAEIYSAMKENDFEKLARSNYLLRELQKLLNLEAEKSEWFSFDAFHLTIMSAAKADRSKPFYFNNGSFNGANLCSADNSSTSGTVCFLADKSSVANCENYLKVFHGILNKLITVEVGDIPVIISIPASISAAVKETDWQSLLNNANDEFEKFKTRQGTEILSQVSRFFIEVNFYKHEFPEKTTKLIANICAEFSDTKIYPFQEMTVPMPDSGAIRCIQKATVILDKPVTKDEFINRMRKYVPQLEEPIFGYGFQSEIRPNFSIQLYARQF